jgi:glycosyltransferase involved in cell wall biosynthesis
MNKSKKIGINLLYINPKTAGGSVTYAMNLVNELAKIDDTNKYILYLNKDCKNIHFDVGANFSRKIIPFRNTNPVKRFFGEQFIFPFFFIKDRLTLLHSLGYHGPIICPFPHIVSILDLNFVRHEAMSNSRKIFLGIMVRIMVKVSKHILTISEFSKREFVEVLKVNEDKVTVTLLSGSSDTIIDHSKENIKNIYKIQSNYIIAFGSTSAHKNITGLLNAFKILTEKKSDIQLLLVGKQHKESDLRRIVNELDISDRVIFAGFVPNEHVFLLLQESSLFVFPSFYEGFGIPLLDAQSCNIPVACSNAGSLPEVGGNGCLYFDPYNTDQMAEIMLNIVDDSELANQLINKGKANREKFSWRITAEQTFQCYLKYSR